MTKPKKKIDLDKLYRVLSKYGYKADEAEFKKSFEKLEKRLNVDTWKGTEIYTYDERFFRFNDDYFDNCLFGISIKQMIQAVYNATYSKQILDRRAMKGAISEIENGLHAIDVYRYCSKSKEYQELLKDPYHRQADHLPNNYFLKTVKDLQCWALLAMIRYFSILAEYKALLIATGGLTTFDVIKQHETTLKYKGRDFLDIYNQYAVSEKHVEDDYIFLNCYVGQLKKAISLKARKFLKEFSIDRFRPTKTTIEAIIKNKILQNKPFFVEDGKDNERIAYKINEFHFNGEYLFQIGKLYKEIIEYIKDKTLDELMEKKDNADTFWIK